MTDVTLDIPEETWIAACQYAAEESLSVSEWVASLMRRELADRHSHEPETESFHGE